MNGPRSYPDRPFVGVGVVVWRGEEMLLVRRGKPPRRGQWSLPGGAQELGETLAQAAEREVLEEAGVRIGDLRLAAVVDLVERDGGGRVLHHYLLIDFTAEWRSGEARAGSDADAVAWVHPRDLPRYTLWRETERVIGLAAATRQRGPAVPEGIARQAT